MDKGNNTVSLVKPSPAPPTITKTLTVTFSPFLHVHSVESHEINRNNVREITQLLNEVKSRPEYQNLPEATKSAVDSFLGLLLSGFWRDNMK